MIDAHCHLDLYQNPTGVAQAADRAGVSTVAVTNLPSAYERAAPHIRQFKRLRPALGLHPLVAEQHARERKKFEKLAGDTFYIGEVGLDFSPQNYKTRDIQVESFRFVLEALRGEPKFITLHSRRAESQVLEMLREAGRAPAVFHWYSGPLATLKEATDEGHYFSVNPAMILSPNGQKIVRAIPPDRLLTETDGPFVKVGTRLAVPTDVALVEEHVAALWGVEHAEAAARIKANFSCLLQTIKGSGS